MTAKGEVHKTARPDNAAYIGHQERQVADVLQHFMAHHQIHTRIRNTQPTFSAQQLGVRCKPGQTPLSHPSCTHKRLNTQKSCRSKPLV